MQGWSSDGRKMDVIDVEHDKEYKCPCNVGEQSPEHLIYECKILEFLRSSLKQHITAGGGT
jgi:hypothetical protein